MPDDLDRRTPEDPKRINVSEPYEVNYWCSTFNCTERELLNAVDRVGDSVKEVEKFLRSK